MEKSENIALDITYRAHPLTFSKPAQTSRDVLYHKPSFFITMCDKSGRKGVGEISLIPGLSLESEEEVRSYLETLITKRGINVEDIPLTLPSVRFAVETALRSLIREG